MDRLSEDESKIVVKVGDSHLLKTKFGYALILNAEYVVFIKDWQVDRNNYGNEVLLTKEYFIPQKWGDFSDEFEDDEENLHWEHWVHAAKEQSKLVMDEEDEVERPINPVHWTK